MFSLPVLDSPKEENRRNLDVEIRGCAEILQFAWDNYQQQLGSEVIRHNLSEIASRNPGYAERLVTSFNSLANYYKRFVDGDPSEWIDIALKKHSRDGVTVELKPTCLIIRVPEARYELVAPETKARTLSYEALPIELRGKIIIMPSSNHDDEHITYKHEVVHTLESRAPIDWPINYDRVTRLIEATNFSQALRGLAYLGEEARRRAISEIVAYEGSEGRSSSLGPYGLDEALGELEAVRRGLSLNSNLSLEDKSELFAHAQREFHGAVHYAIAARHTFLDRIQTVGATKATAEALVLKDIKVNWKLHQQIVDNIEARITSAITESTTKVENYWWSNEWCEIRELLNYCPHPQLLNLVCTAMQQSSNMYLVDDMMRVLIDGLKLDPDFIPDASFSKVLDYVQRLASDDKIDNKWLKETINRFLDLEGTGLLRGSPFYPSDRTPEGLVSEAIKSASPSQSIVKLYVENYPNRHPFWAKLQSGVFMKNIHQLPTDDVMTVSLAIAEHSSHGFDVYNAVSWLTYGIKHNCLSEQHFDRLKRLSSILPECNNDQIKITDNEMVLTEYLANRKIISEYVSEVDKTKAEVS